MVKNNSILMDTPHPKKQKLDEIQNSNSQQVPSCFPKYYIISGTDEQNPMKKVSPMKGNLIVKAQIGTVEKIMRMPNGDLIVGLLNQAQITNAKKNNYVRHCPGKSDSSLFHEQEERCYSMPCSHRNSRGRDCGGSC